MKSMNLALGTLLLLGAADSSADVLLTENFELPDTANFITFNAPSSIVTATNTWQVTVSGVDLFEDAARPEAVAFDGGQAVDLAGSPGAGVISTTLATTPGSAYKLTFHYARNNLIGATTADALVEVIGATTVLSAPFSHGSPDAFSVQKLFQQSFIADASTCTLRFSSLETGNSGVTIDAISIATVEIGVFPYAAVRPTPDRAEIARQH